MKGSILHILRSEPEVVSGERLSAELGVSRVSIWKHVRKLQDLGYAIESSARGYRLSGDTDVPYPWEFVKRESTMHYFPEVTSTMEIAKQLAREGCPHFTTVVAGRQSRGRGRLKRHWISQDGGLYFTLVLRPRVPPVVGFRLSFAAAVVLVQTLRDRFDIAARVKWPNDILVGPQKICGILSELEAEADSVSFINIGMGINVNNDPSNHEPNAVSIQKILNRSVSRKALLAEVLDRLEPRIRVEHLDSVVDEWKRYTETLNRAVEIRTINGVSRGIAVDVDENGALLLKDDAGGIRKILCGDLFER